MSKTWYTVSMSNEIQEMEVTRETTAWLFWKSAAGFENQVKKRSRSGVWYKTRKEAVDHARANLQQQVRSAKWAVQRAQEELAEFNRRER